VWLYAQTQPAERKGRDARIMTDGKTRFQTLRLIRALCGVWGLGRKCRHPVNE